MSEHGDNESRVHKPIVTKEESGFLSDIWKFARDEYIVPKSYEVAHDMFAGITNMLADAAIGALDKIFYDRESGSNYISSRSGNTDFNKISTEKAKKENKNTSPASTRPYAEKVEIKDYKKAVAVRDEMIRIIKQYDYVRVADLYELVDRDTNSIDWMYGWTDESQIRFQHMHGTHVFNLPDPVPVRNK